MSEHMALVTRAFADIGRATAMTFTREGVSVAVSGRRDEEGTRRLAALAGRPFCRRRSGASSWVSTGP